VSRVDQAEPPSWGHSIASSHRQQQSLFVRLLSSKANTDYVKAIVAAVVIRTVVVMVVEASATSMDILEVVMEVAAVLEAIACRTLVQVFRSKTGVSYREGQQHIWDKLTHMI